MTLCKSSLFIASLIKALPLDMLPYPSSMQLEVYLGKHYDRI